MNPFLHFAYFREKRLVKARLAWPDSLMNQAKATGDELGDQVVSDIIQNHSIDKVNELLEHLDQEIPAEGIELPSGMPSSVNTYLQAFEELPSWADTSKILRAQKFFTAHGPSFGISLMFKSLPVLYLGKMGGVQVLNMTGQLKDHFQRRAAETLQFVLDVMSRGGLQIKEDQSGFELGSGIRTLQKIRLMHASVRHFAQFSGQWPEDGSWGAPINQEELVGTMLAFSSVALDGLTQMGIEPTDQEVDDYFHTWKVIGHFLGIHPEFMPSDIKSAGFQWLRLDERNFGPTQSGIELTDSHVEFLKKVVPGDLMDNIVPTLMTYLLGFRYAHWLKVGRVGWTVIFISLFKWIFSIKEKFTHASGTTEALYARWSLKLMQNLEKEWMEGTGNAPPFRIPHRSSMSSIPGRPPEGKPIPELLAEVPLPPELKEEP